MILRILRAMLLPVLLMAGSIQASAVHAQAPASAGAESLSYALGPDDEIEISVFGQESMRTKTRIRSDGTVILPLLGTVQVAGKTTAQLSAMISELYKATGILASPSVNVEITTYASKTVTILGAVPNSGLYALDRPYSVADMVAKAGGIREDGANVVILTSADGQPATRISLVDIAGAASRKLAPGDKLFVPIAEQVFVYGPVNKPGAYPYLTNMTYRQALAQAGGPTVAGSSRKIEVRRDGKEIRAKIDDPAMPGDVLIIKEKFF